MKLLVKTEICRRLRSIIFISGTTLLILYNIWNIILTDFGFDVGWSFFLFQNNPFILIMLAINTSLKIGQDTCGKILYNKIILGYSTKSIYNSQILVGIIEVISLFVIDTTSIIIFSLFRNFTLDISFSTLIINLIITVVSLTVVSVFITMAAVIIPHRILTFFIVICISLVLLQKGEDLSFSLLEPKQTIFFNSSDDEPPIDNPLYIEGTERDIYNFELLISPYAQIQYEKFILFEEKEQKIDSSFILNNLPYHFEFILVGISEILFFYYIGLKAIRDR